RAPGAAVARWRRSRGTPAVSPPAPCGRGWGSRRAVPARRSAAPCSSLSCPAPPLGVSFTATSAGGRGFLLDAVLHVALGLKLVGQLLATRLHNAPTCEHVHEVGLDVLENPGVVGDQQHAGLAGGAVTV